MPPKTRRRAKEDNKEDSKIFYAQVVLTDVRHTHAPLLASSVPDPESQPARKRRKISTQENDNPPLRKGTKKTTKGKSTKKRKPVKRKAGSTAASPNSKLENDPYDLASCTCHESFRLISTILEQAQTFFDKSDRYTGLKRLKDYYSTHSNARELALHQKRVSASLWLNMLPVFQWEKNSITDNLIKFFQMAIVGIGFPASDASSSKNKELLPMLSHILHFMYLYQSDEIPQVRLQILKILKFILDHFRDKECEPLERVRDKIIPKILTHRIKDKAKAVRIAALRCISYFMDDRSARKLVSFTVSYDINPEVRRLALNILHDTKRKNSFLYERAFDPSEAVRAEAFLKMAKLPMNRVGDSARDRRKFLYWGLNQSSDKIRLIVHEILLPEWLSQNDNSLISLIDKLKIGNKLNLASLIIESLYPDGSTEEFEKIDWSFLPKEQKLIPIPELTLIKAQVWVLLCRKFQNTSSCAYQLIPEASKFVTYLKDLLEDVRQYHEDSKHDKEQDYSKFITLGLMFKLGDSLDYEESVRREMVELLKSFLLDPIIEDSVIINSLVDLANEIIDPKKLSAYADTIMKDFFGWNTIVMNESNVEYEGQENMDVKVEPADEGIQDNNSLHSINASPSHRHRSPFINTVILKSPSNKLSTPVRSQSPFRKSSTPVRSPLKKVLTPTRSPLKQMSSVTPVTLPPKDIPPPMISHTPTRRITVAEQLLEFRQKEAEIIFQRHRLISDLEKATVKADYLSCHNLQKEIDNCKEREKELKAQIDELKSIENQDGYMDDIQDKNAEDQSVLRGGEPIYFDEENVSRISFDDGEEEQEDLNETSMDIGEQSMIVLGESDASIRKALTILLRFLIYTRKITPVVDDICKHNLLECITHQDARVRGCTIRLLCIYGKLDKTQSRKSMLISLQAFRYDSMEAQLAGFESIVDLLVDLSIEFFRPKNPTELQLDLPSPFDNPDATFEEIEAEVISLLSSFGGDEPTKREINTQIKALTKLFLAGRIRNLELLAEFLGHWINPDLVAASVVSIMGKFIPYYCIISTSNCELLFEAFILCVKTVTERQELNDNEDGLGRADVLKLAEYIAMNTHAETIYRFKDAHLVHEKGFVRILEEVERTLGEKCAIPLARSLKFFSVATTEAKIKVEGTICDILQEIKSDKQMVGGPQIKVSLQSVLKQMNKRFNLNLFATIKEEPDVGNEDYGSEIEVYDNNILSDSEENTDPPSSASSLS